MVKLNCGWCNKEFNRPEYAIKKNNFCSVACSGEWQKINNPKGKDHCQYKRVILKCAWCEKEMEKTPYYAKKEYVFCSHSCRGKYMGKRAIKRIEKPCGWCGTILSLVPSLVRENNFCNYDCRSSWYSQNYSGSNSPQYRDGLKVSRPRGKNWANISKAIRARDGKCIACGSVENLCVHHILPRYEWGDRVDEINIPSNLVTLCGSCHSKVTNNDDILLEGEGWDYLRDYMAKFSPEQLREVKRTEEGNNADDSI